MIDIVNILILHVDDTSILLQHKLRTFDTAILVKVRKNEDIIKAHISSGLEGVREEKLFPTDELDSILVNLIVSYKILIELCGRTSRITILYSGTFVTLLRKIELSSYCVFGELFNWDPILLSVGEYI